MGSDRGATVRGFLVESGCVRATVPAFLLRTSLLNWGHSEWLAGCAPPQFAQVAGTSKGLGQSCARWSSPHLTHASRRWHPWLECRNAWQRWHCAGPLFTPPGFYLNCLTQIQILFIRRLRRETASGRGPSGRGFLTAPITMGAFLEGRLAHVGGVVLRYAGTHREEEIR